MDGGAYVAFDVLESLKNFRDTRKCLDGLNKLRTALKSGDGLRVLGQLAEASPNLEELIIIWDHQNKAQEYSVAITLMLTLVDIFTLLAPTPQKSITHPSPATSAAATALATALLPRRLHTFYSHLASQQRSRSTAALLLLAALASFNLATARELVRAFDFSLAALPPLARPLRARKGESAAEHAARQRHEWSASDPLKRPTRAAFSVLTLALLRTADSQLLPEMLRLRPLIGGTLHYLSSDPPALQEEVLKVVFKRVLGARAMALGSTAKADVFSDAALGQLASICAADEDAEENEESNEAVAVRQQQAASNLANQILSLICTDPRHGICAETATAGEFCLLQASSSAALSSGQRKLLRWLHRLRPAESAAHGDLLRACVSHDPALAAAMLLSLQVSMEPVATGKWLVHAGVVGSLVRCLAGAPTGLIDIAKRGLPPPELSGRSMQGALRCALPPSLPRAALSRGVQHGNALVRHSMLCLLGHMLTCLETLFDEATAAATAAAASNVRDQWDEFNSALQHVARAALPDLQPILAQLAAAVSGKQQSSFPPPAAVGGLLPTSIPSKQEDLEPFVNTIEVEEAIEVVVVEELHNEASENASGFNSALFSATMHVLQLWRRCLPTSLAESNVDVEKIAAEYVQTLPPLHQLQMIHLLENEKFGASKKKKLPFPLSSSILAVAQSGLGPALLPVLRVFASTQQEEVRNAAGKWAVGRLLATGLFEANPGEACLWINLIPTKQQRNDGGTTTTDCVEAAFLNDALALVLRKPGEFYSLSAAAAAPGTENCSTTCSLSLLVLCVLRQAVRVLSSEKKSDVEKAAIAAYTAQAATLAVLQETGVEDGKKENMQGGVAAMLRVLRSEADRSSTTAAATANNVGVLSPAAAAASNSGSVGGGAKKRKAHDDEEEEEAGVVQRENENRAAVHAMLQSFGTAAAPLEKLTTWLEESLSSSLDLNYNKKTKKRKGEIGAMETTALANLNLRHYLASTPLTPDLLSPSPPPSSSIASLLALLPVWQWPFAAVMASFRDRKSQSQMSNVVEEESIKHLCSTPTIALNICEYPGQALFIVRQTLHLLTFAMNTDDDDRDGTAVAMLCALLRGVLTAAVAGKSPPHGETQQCIAACCDTATIQDGAFTLQPVCETLLFILNFSYDNDGDEIGKFSTSICSAIHSIFSTLLISTTSTSATTNNSALESPPSVFLTSLLPAAVHAASADEAGSSLSAFLTGITSSKSEIVHPGWVSLCATSLHAFNLSSTSASRKKVDDKNLCQRGCAAVASLLSKNQSNEACELLTHLLERKGSSGAHWRANVLQTLGDSTISTIIHSSLLLPSPVQSSLACLLLKHSTTAVVAFSLALQRGELRIALGKKRDDDDAASEDAPYVKKQEKEKKKKKKEEENDDGDDESVRWHRLAAVLPSVTTYFEILAKKEGETNTKQHAAAQPTKDDDDDDDDDDGGADDPDASTAAQLIVQELLAWLTQDTSCATTTTTTTTTANTSSQSSSSSTTPSSSLLLRSWCIPCLSHLLLSPTLLTATTAIDGSSSSSLSLAVMSALTALTNTKDSSSGGWSVTDAALGGDASSLSPTSLNRAAAVNVLLQFLLTLNKKQRQLTDAEKTVSTVTKQMNTTTTTTTTAAAAASPVDGNWLTSKTLCAISRVFFSTLAALFKIQRPSPLQISSEWHFLTLLDTFLNDAIAALPTKQRSSAEFAALAVAVCSEFARAVFRRRADDPLALRALRRLTAALLPVEMEIGVESNNNSNNNNNQQQQQHQDDDDDSDSENDDREGFSGNAVVSTTAAELFQRAVTHSLFLPTMRNTAASPPPLPPSAGNIPLPLQSLLPLVDVECGEDPSVFDLVISSFGKESVDLSGVASMRLPIVKKELCMLLETLLDLEETFKAADGLEKSENSSSKGLIVAEEALLPVVMAAYGGSLSCVDVAVWDLARALNLRAWRRNGGGGGVVVDEMDIDDDDDDDDDEKEGKEELQALLEGPLAKNYFAFGPGAVAAAAAAAADTATTPDLQALQALQSKLVIDPLRCALTVTHFPERQSLFGLSSFSTTTTASSPSDENDDDGSGNHQNTNLPPALPTTPAAYDPSFLLLFCVTALRGKLLPPRIFTQSGLASVCLRATAAQDDGLRGLAFEALALLTEQVQPPVQGQSSRLFQGGQSLPYPHPKNPGFGEGTNGKAAAALSSASSSLVGGGGGDFKERSQLCALLEWVKNFFTTPFSQLPVIHAVFAAEAALLLSHPAHTLFTLMSKARLKTAVVDVTLVPLFRQIILSGSQDARTERTWLLRLLRAGLRSGADARIFSRQYILELVMGLYDSATIDPGTAKLAMDVVVAACAVPRAARELAEKSGVVGWLASRAASAAAAAVNPTTSPLFSGTTTSSSNSSVVVISGEKLSQGKFFEAVAAVDALRTLTMLRAVVGSSLANNNNNKKEVGMENHRGGGGGRSVWAVEDFSQACHVMLSVLCQLSSSSDMTTMTTALLTAPQAAGLARIWATVLPLCVWIQEASSSFISSSLLIKSSTAFLSLNEAWRVVELATKMAVEGGDKVSAQVHREIKVAGERLIEVCMQ